jgi:hypothetical protein
MQAVARTNVRMTGTMTRARRVMRHDAREEEGEGEGAIECTVTRKHSPRRFTHGLNRGLQLTDKDSDDRDHNEAAGHCIELIVP